METPREDIDTECPICLLVLRQPSQVECCGRVFCTGCLQRALRDNDCCPMCKARAPRVFTDQNIRRILAGFRVYCVHRYSRERGDAFSFPLYFAPNFLLFLPPFFYLTPIFIYLQSSPTFLISPSPQVVWRRRERVPVDWGAGTAGQPPEPQS